MYPLFGKILGGCPSCGGSMVGAIMICKKCYAELPNNEKINATKVLGNKAAEKSKVDRWVRVLKEKRETAKK